MDKQTQAAIIEQVKRISFHKNPRVWFAISMLMTYGKVRPGELIQVNEGDIDRRARIMWIRHAKEGKEKPIHLIDEDLQFINSLPQGHPERPFFRHERVKGISRAYKLRYRGRFGKDYL